MNTNNLITLGGLPRWGLMWFLAGSMFLAGKMLVRRRMKGRDDASWPAWKSAAWYLLWPGMNVADFNMARPRHSPSLAMALAKIAAGSFLIWGVAHHFSHPLAASWCGMVGLILVLHFGVFDLLAIFWQSRGFRASPIMQSPVTATSLADFWGRRWNRAFRDLTHPYVFAPVTKRLGPKAALWISFAVSGLAHELVISIPAGAGFGLPTFYFLLQALGIGWERKIGISHEPRPVAAWLFTHAFTVLPAFFLFHPPFVERVMIPFFHAIHSIP